MHDRIVRSFLVRLALASVVAAPLINAACGSKSGLADDTSGEDAGADGSSSDSGSPLKDSGSAIVDSGADAVCPAQYEVFGSTDPSDDLGHVDPRLIASGICYAPFEQLRDGGFPATDLMVTMTQSALASGMFVTQIHQTTPFALDRTVCLQSSGPNTGAAGYPDDGGLMCLTDVPEDRVPWDPNFVMFTNLEDADGGVFIDIDQSTEAGVAATNSSCRFLKN